MVRKTRDYPLSRSDSVYVVTSSTTSLNTPNKRYNPTNLLEQTRSPSFPRKFGRAIGTALLQGRGPVAGSLHVGGGGSLSSTRPPKSRVEDLSGGQFDVGQGGLVTGLEGTDVERSSVFGRGLVRRVRFLKLPSTPLWLCSAHGFFKERCGAGKRALWNELKCVQAENRSKRSWP